MKKSKMNISFTGIKELDPIDQERAKDIIISKYPFIEREIKKINKIKLHIKTHNSGGNKKYSIHLKVYSPAGIFVADNANTRHEWDPITSIHVLIDKIREQINHTYKNN